MSSATRRQLSQARTTAAAALTPENIHRMQKDQLLRLQASSGLGGEWGTIVIPASWCTPGTAQAPAYRRIDVNSLEGSADDLEEGRLALSRYALLLLYCKVAGRGYKQIFLAPDTIRGSLVLFKTLLQKALRSEPVHAGPLLARLSSNDVLAMPRAPVLLGELRRVQRFVAQGLWADAPTTAELGEIEDSIAETVERARIVKKTKGGTFKPLPDDFVAEAGWRLIWVIEHLGPSIVECGRELIRIRRSVDRSEDASAQVVAARLQKLSTEFLSSYRWLAPNGKEISEIPFDVQITRSFGEGSAEFEWPPRMYVDFLRLLWVLQDAHMFVFLLSTGGRISETLSLEPNCVVSVEPDKETVQGRTYKLVFSSAGEKREWPLPTLALEAIQQQVKLSEVITALGEMKKTRARQPAADSIWVSGNGAQWRELPTKRLTKTIRAIGIVDMLGAKWLNSHRFRKTLARIVALALVGAPKILMDLFGHKSIEMTLHYMTTDPQLRAEIKEVARAQTIMFAENAIHEAEKNGGGGGSRLRAALRKERARLGRDFGEDDIRQLAETLTDNGTTWMLVRPGVICTKSVGQAGPCNRSLGRPEPSRCRSKCDHRLEEAALRDDVDRSLEEDVGYLADALRQDDEIQAEMWRGQVLTHLPRFEDLRVKWSTHPVVANLLGKSTGDGVMA
jgi:integrase